MESELLTLRQYGEGIGDWQMVSGWYQARHGTPMPETDLPPLGLIVEDAQGPAAALWAAQWNGVGVADACRFVTRPGLSLRKARAAGLRCLEGACAILKADFYELLKCFCPRPAMWRELRRVGFAGDNGIFAIRTEKLCPRL